MVLIPLFLPLEFADTWGSTSTFLLDRNSRFCLLLLFSKSYGYDDRRVLLFSLFFFLEISAWHLLVLVVFIPALLVEKNFWFYSSFQFLFVEKKTLPHPKVIIIS